MEYESRKRRGTCRNECCWVLKNESWNSRNQQGNEEISRRPSVVIVIAQRALAVRHWHMTNKSVVPKVCLTHNCTGTYQAPVQWVLLSRQSHPTSIMTCKYFTMRCRNPAVTQQELIDMSSNLPPVKWHDLSLLHSPRCVHHDQSPASTGDLIAVRKNCLHDGEYLVPCEGWISLI